MFSTILNLLMEGDGESSACTDSVASWPCIAVTQGSAQKKEKKKISKRTKINKKEAGFGPFLNISNAGPVVVVVVQLVERLLPIPEIRGSNPVIA